MAGFADDHIHPVRNVPRRTLRNLAGVARAIGPKHQQERQRKQNRKRFFHDEPPKMTCKAYSTNAKGTKMRRVWSAVTYYRRQRPRLVAARFNRRLLKR